MINANKTKVKLILVHSREVKIKLKTIESEGEIRSDFNSIMIAFMYFPFECRISNDSYIDSMFCIQIEIAQVL